MTSIVLFIASAIAVIAGVAYAVYNYVPYIVNFWNSILETFETIKEYFPDWILPYLWIPVTLCVIGILIKLF